MSDGSTIAVDVLVAAGPWPAHAEAAGLVSRAIRAAHAGAMEEYDLGIEQGEVAVMLTDDAGIRTLNLDWRSKDKATNVLSFPTPQVAREAGEPHLGDIAIAYETVAREAAAEEKSFDDHLTHLAVHGMLHLLGFDHETPDEAEEMEAMERRILSGLGIADPYAETEPVHQTH
ncbi:rRNA maturation RNase YbeY [Ancylobacter defluvii]|uniref:Endoribonuclease YbeY n=1 Tax=Ancylobacter defluvii TaxID=1282440 RepID=A0A9W6JT55_9HYPH|nr:rRNA maturation RNase YbeY [Ancylobacter defluvii]MBS7590434.1 rRNA maturation RNase YbeY [Ancylobacter defluvii]GLK83355.1 endoribonuclease YbeY [Ancylobacter defluvii]